MSNLLQLQVNRKFTAVFPKEIDVGDSVRLRGKLQDKAKIFSINFTGDDMQPMPNIIPYQFQTRFTNPTNTGVQHNHKNQKWAKETVDQQTWVDGPGSWFDVEFIFQHDNISICTEAGTQYRFQFEKSKYFKLIKFLQIWDDLDHIQSIEFKYNKTR